MNPRCGGETAAVNIKLDASGAGEIRIQHVQQAEIDSPGRGKIRRLLALYRNAALQVDVRRRTLELSGFKGYNTVAIVCHDRTCCADLHFLVRSGEDWNLQLRLHL